MSVDLYVYLHGDRIPSCQEWQDAIRGAGYNLEFEDFSTRNHQGFIPIRLEGIDCGFEYLLAPVDQDNPSEIQAIIGDRDFFAEFIWHSNMEDCKAAMIAAATLAQITNGFYFDPQSGACAEGSEAFSLLRDQLTEEANWRRNAAEKKWASTTQRRCPECNSPCPEYRKSCWVCGFEVGRVK